MSLPSELLPVGLLGTGAADTGYLIERSLRFNSADSSFLSRTPSGQDSTWTLSFWMKCPTSGNQMIFGSYGGGASYLQITAAQLNLYLYRGTTTSIDVTSNAVLRDFSAWYHIHYKITSGGTGYLYINGVLDKSFACGSVNYLFPSSYQCNISGYGSYGGYYFDGYLADVYYVAGQALDPTSFGQFDANGIWQPIAYTGTYGTNGFHLPFSDNSTDAALGTDTSGNGNDWTVNNIIADSVSSSGPWLTGFRTAGPQLSWNSGTPITTLQSGSTLATTGNTTGLRIDTQELAIYNLTVTRLSGDNMQIHSSDDPAIFSQTTHATGATGSIAINSSGTSTYTFKRYIAFEGSGGGNVTLQITGTVGDSTQIDSLVDVPTNGNQTDTGVGGEVRGNYCTWNPLKELTGGYNLALSNGNLEATNGGDGVGTLSFGSGKKYFELTVQSASSFSQGYYGIVDIAKHIIPRSWATSEIAALRDTGSLYGDGSTGAAPAATQVGDIYGFAVDVDNQKLFISVNGTYLNGADPAAGTGASFTGRDFSNYAPLASLISTNSQVLILNAGQRPFAYQAPSGFKALNTANLPAPTIEDGSTAMDIALYGGGASSYTISGLKFSPDLVWSKRRDAAGRPALVDRVRGATIQLSSDRTSAELTVTDGLETFNSDGYIVGDDTGEYGWNGGAGSAFVNWIWDAGTPPTRTHTQPKLYTSTTLYTTAADVVANATARNGGESITNEYVYLVTNSGGRIGEGVFSANGTLTSPWYMLLREGASWVSHGSYNTTDPASFKWRQDFVPGSSTYTCANNVELHLISSGTSPATTSVTLPTLATTTDDGAVANTSGSIESRVRANPSAGFSIVTYTGTGANATVGHGLGVAPKLLIIKNRDSGYNWIVGSSSLTSWDYELKLDTPDAQYQSGSVTFNSTAPTSSVFSLGSTGSVNFNRHKFVAYCFAPVEGYSAFGSYTGNGLADGPFVYTGFRPKWILVKASSASSTYTSWGIWDSTRNPTNVNLNALWANENYGEGTRGDGSTASLTQLSLDSLSNGFKMRNNGNEFNISAVTYVFAAFAEHPFQYARAR